MTGPGLGRAMRGMVLVAVAMLAVPLAVALAAPQPAVDAAILLPDLASLPPDHFTFTAPDGSADGCLAHEEEAGARRCLRFTTYLTNVGEGRLDLALAPGDGAGRPLVQRLHSSDGSWEVRPAGSVEFHAVHDHYHVAGLVAFALRPVLADGAVDTNATAVGGKTGFCLFDGTPGSDDPASARTYRRWNCRALDNPGVGMGISPGWVDRYNWTLADQFLEVSHVPDGDYELTVVADPGRAILESSVANNAATVRLRIAGQSVALLPTESP